MSRSLKQPQFVQVPQASTNMAQLPFSFGPMVGQQESRTVYLVGEVSEESINAAQQQILELAAMSTLPIYLVVSTYGGSVDEMFSLYDVINFVRCPIYTIGLGKIMSAGSLILASGQKGHRLLGKNARVMIHSLSAGAMGSYFQILNEADELKRQQDLYIELMSENTKMSKKQIETILNSKIDKYLTPQQAIEFGIIDSLM